MSTKNVFISPDCPLIPLWTGICVLPGLGLLDCGEHVGADLWTDRTQHGNHTWARLQQMLSTGFPKSLHQHELLPATWEIKFITVLFKVSDCLGEFSSRCVF